MTGCFIHFQNLSDRGAKLLDEVRESLETETHQIDALHSQVKSGSKLLKQKEEKLQELEDLTKEVNVDVWCICLLIS